MTTALLRALFLFTDLSALFPAAAPAVPPRPNILWLTSEDHGPHLGCYGDTLATTPNVDRFAARGMIYTRVWSCAPVCARPALGEDLGYGLRLRAIGTGGAMAPCAKRDIRSVVSCTLDGWCAPRFQPLRAPERPSWSLRRPSGAGRRPLTSPRRTAKHLPGDNSAPVRVEWPHLVRHTPAMSKKQDPISKGASPASSGRVDRIQISGVATQSEPPLFSRFRWAMP
jgi:hypothetical protein